jgi:hypothetical protein
MGEKKQTRFILYSAVAATLAAGALTSRAQSILSPGDFIIAIDNNRNLPGTFNTAGTETPASVLDQNPATKYLNFGREMTGIIVQPQFGASVVQSFTLTTANDGSERDPAAYLLYGTNSPVTSADNSDGKSEAWTLIQSGSITLPQTRQTLSAPIDVTNSATYSAYKLLFPQLKKINASNLPANPNSKQVADIQLYNGPAAGGSALLAVGDTIRGIDETDSAYPPTERPLEAIDGLKDASSKYLNFGREGTGLIVTPSKGATIAKSLRLTTANDTPSRDPSKYEIYGTNDTITSFENSAGDYENWTLIASGDIVLPDGRNVTGDFIPFDSNNTPYTSYKIIFPDNKGPDTGTGSANSIQFSEVELFDAVPEPSGVVVALVGGLISLTSRRRRNA